MSANGFDLGFGAFAGLAFLWGLFITILWLVIGWRAMRAHERIANALAEIAHRRRSHTPPDHSRR